MNENLKNLCDMVSRNFENASAFYMMEYKSAFASYAVTNSDREHSPDKIDEVKQLLKESLGKAYSFGSGAPRMEVLSKALRSDDPAGTVDKIKRNYDLVSKVYSPNAFMAALAVFLTDCQGDIDTFTAKSTELLKIMRKRHPLLGVSSTDHPVIALMAMSDKSADEMIRESDIIFDGLKKDFKFDKENAYTLSYLLSTYGDPSEWKLKSAAALREELKEQKIKFSSYGSIAMLAPLTAASMRTDRSVIVNDIAEADKYFAAQKGIGGVFGLSESIRHMLAASCVLKAIGEDNGTFSECEYLTVMSCQAQIKSEQDSAATTTTMM